MEKNIEKIEKRLSGIEKELRNHITEMMGKVSSLITDVAWIKRFFWVFMTPAIGVIVAALIYLIIK